MCHEVFCEKLKSFFFVFFKFPQNLTLSLKNAYRCLTFDLTDREIKTKFLAT